MHSTRHHFSKTLTNDNAAVAGVWCKIWSTWKRFQERANLKNAPSYLFSIEITLKQIFVTILSLDTFGFSIRALLLELFSQKKKNVKLGWSQKSNIHGQIWLRISGNWYKKNAESKIETTFIIGGPFQGLPLNKSRTN